MAFYKAINIRPGTTLYLWKITEDFDTLFREVRLKDVSLARLEGMKSEPHQKGFMAVRMLLQYLGYSDFDLYYDDFGKPHLSPNLNDESQKQEKIHISISHSGLFSGILVSNENVGLDIEQLKPKTLHIASRFMTMSHLDNLPEAGKIKKATVIWGIKETVFKIKNEAGISFPDHISEKPFCFEDRQTTAKLEFKGQTEYFDTVFDAEEDYIYVCAFTAGFLS